MMTAQQAAIVRATNVTAQFFKVEDGKAKAACVISYAGYAFFFFNFVEREAVSMIKMNTRVAKRLFISLTALAALSGCAVVPYNSGYYDQPVVYGGPAVYAAPSVYVAPAVNFGFQYRSNRGYHGHRHHGGGRHHGRGSGHRHR